MGWCSGTVIFDDMCSALLDEKRPEPEKILSRLIDTLEDMDWDCQYDSDYIDHPVVKKLFVERGIIEDEESGD